MPFDDERRDLPAAVVVHHLVDLLLDHHGQVLLVMGAVGVESYGFTKICDRSRNVARI